MEITWYGHSCFRLTEKDLATVVADPYDFQMVGYPPLSLEAEIVTVSHNKPGHNFVRAVKGDPFVISSAGEYEIGGVFVTGLQTNGKTKDSSLTEVNTMYVYDYNGLNVVHLGGLDRVPNQREIEELGPVHVALVPIGGTTTINAAKAAEVVNLLDANVVIPMHYMTDQSKIELDTLNKFLKEMGISHLETQTSLKLSNPKTLPEETQVIVLEPQVS